jgi:hypothetical protein
MKAISNGSNFSTSEAGVQEITLNTSETDFLSFPLKILPLFSTSLSYVPGANVWSTLVVLLVF